MSGEDYFVNPYTFLPLPERVVRAAPTYHVGVEDARRPLFSGHVEVTWTLESAMLLPANAIEEGWVAPAANEGEASDPWDIRVPGSAVKGGVRSLHETMFNGCLRVFDEDFVPVYREAASPAALSGFRLAVVLKVEGHDGVNRPVKVQLCEQDLLYLEASSLGAVYAAPPSAQEPTGPAPASPPPPAGRAPTPAMFAQKAKPAPRPLPPTTGDLVALDYVEEMLGGRVVTRFGKDDTATVHHRAGAQVTGAMAESGLLRTGLRVFVVTATDARDTRNPAYWASSRLTGDTAQVASGAWDRFMAHAADSRDVLQPPRAKYVEVTWNGRPVGRRQRVGLSADVGDVFWVRLEHGEVADLKPSQLWRRSTDSSPAQMRLGTGSASTACATADLLCLSCATFGSVDATGDKAGRGEQDAYAGHVRFGPATARGVRLSPGPDWLTPMGTPHPGAGAFYLEPLPGFPATDKDRPRHDIASQWGSRVEGRRARALRGRKFYWHADPDAQQRRWSLDRPRYAASPEQVTNAQQARQQGREPMARPEPLLVERGTTLTCRVVVDRLDAVGVQALLHALDPGPFLDPDGTRSVAVHLGGGKPFGLGSASPAIRHTLVRTRSRYGDDTSEGATGDAFATRADLVDRCGDLSHLPALAKVLDREGLGEWADHVAYPPDASWAAADTEAFRHSYEFFKASRGEKFGWTWIRKEPVLKLTTWRSLPLVTDTDQRLGIRPGPDPATQDHGLRPRQT